MESFEGLKKVGPNLGHVASKTTSDFLYQWIRNPQAFRSSTRMPRFFDLTNTGGSAHVDYADTSADDFSALLELDVAAPLFFTIGQTAGAGDTINAWRHDMPLFRGTTTDKVDDDSGKVVRTITGYASHTTVDAELVLTAV